MRRAQLLVGVGLATSLSLTVHLHAFSVGDLVVQSHLGAPFAAEVRLEMEQHERDQSLVVIIGDQREYEAEGVSRLPVVDLLRPTVTMGPPEKIRVFSAEPIQVPSFDLVLLVRSGKLTIVRSYPIALSAPSPPPPMAAKPAVPVATKPAAPMEKRSEVVPAALPQSKRPQAGRAKATMSPTQTPWVKGLPRRYGPVQPGETLYSILEKLAVPRSAIGQAAVFLWQANPDQFSHQNLHGLLSGVSVRIPVDLEQITASMPPDEAHKIILAQWEEWQNLQRVKLDQQDTMPSEPQAVLVQRENRDATPAAAEPAVPTPTVVLSTQEPSSLVTVMELESVLQGLEDRLTQRLSMPPLTSQKQADDTVSFVSTAELRTALQGLEGRLMQQLQRTMQQQIGLEWSGTLLPPQAFTPSLPQGLNIKTLFAPLLSTTSLLYVLAFQNILLFAVACRFAWRWYRSRA